MDNITAYVSANPNVEQTFLLPKGKKFPSEAVQVPDSEAFSDNYFYIWASFEERSGLMKYSYNDIGQKVRIAIHRDDLSKVDGLIDRDSNDQNQ